MQALRLGSFLNTPTLLAIQTLVLMGPYLTNSGRFLDAWTLFGTTIRSAHSIGLHRDPRLLTPVPNERESMLRRTLWWWLLHMDQQYSVTLGRPLGISGLGDCPPPEPLSVNALELRLTKIIQHFTILARQILASSELLKVTQVDHFTDCLVSLWETMPGSLKFNESWLRQVIPLPDWPLEIMSTSKLNVIHKYKPMLTRVVFCAKMHSLIILLNRQRVDCDEGKGKQSDRSQPSEQRTISTQPAGRLGKEVRRRPPHHTPPHRGRPLVIDSSLNVVFTFLFLHKRVPAVLVCWNMSQQAFNACMILLLDAFETRSHVNLWLVEEADRVFRDMDSNSVHGLAKVASESINRALSEIRRGVAASLQQGGGTSSASDTRLEPVVPLMGERMMGNVNEFLLEGLIASDQPRFRPLSSISDSAAVSTARHFEEFRRSADRLPVINCANPSPFPMSVSVTAVACAQQSDPVAGQGEVCAPGVDCSVTDTKPLEQGRAWKARMSVQLRANNRTRKICKISKPQVARRATWARKYQINE